MSVTNKYFIAVVPDDPVKNRVHNFKLHCEEKYHSRAALKSPPHITLFMPFLWDQKKDERLFAVLKEVGQKFKAFSIQLKNFSAFVPRVIFVDVIENEELENLQKVLVKDLKRHLHIIDNGYVERPFRPHMTIAFRDLKKPQFLKAWEEEFQAKEYGATFSVREITLLKHNGNMWEEHRNFPLIES